MNNKKIKLMLRGNGIPQWKLAEAMNVSEITVQRLLRNDEKELPKQKQDEIIKLVDSLIRL